MSPNTESITISKKVFKSARALDTWLAGSEGQKYNMDRFPAALLSSKALIEHEEYSDCGRYFFTLADRSVADEIVTLAMQIGLILNKNASRWTAIEPTPEFWDNAPGAYIRWTGYLTARETESGRPNVLCVSYEPVLDDQHITHMQGVDGWRVSVETTNHALNVYYSNDNSSESR